jgi:FRG domain-containing protein
MPIKNLKPISSLSDYLDRIASVRTAWRTKKENWEREPVTRKGEEEQLWFRGQPADVGLSPRFHRRGYEDADEAEIRQQFQSRALQLMQARVPESDRIWDWYFLMQHYGAPTRLLDWTDNPLIGLFFAVNSEPVGADAAVWILDPYWLNDKLFKDVVGPLLPDWAEAQKYLKKLEAAFMSYSKTSMWRPAALDPPHVDRRLATQASHFVIFGRSKDLTKIRLVKRKDCRLAKVVIPKSSVERIGEELADCGITHSFVFPDLEALGEELARFWKRHARA